MNTYPLALPNPAGRLSLGMIIAIMSFSCILSLHAETAVKNAASKMAATNSVSTPGMIASPSATASTSSAAPPFKADTDDDDNVAIDGHSGTITIKGNHGEKDLSMRELAPAILIPLAGVVGAFGTPILIVFFFCYFKYRRRRENLITVREYLNKGLPVPPQLLDESLRSVYVAPEAISRGRSDIRKGMKWAAIGLGVSLALYFNDPRSTDWAWGLIPLVLGIGFLISGSLEVKQGPATPENPPLPPLPPPGVTR